MKRKISKIIIHCSGSNNLLHDDIEVIKVWHLERGFLDVGYHFYIKKNGCIQIGRDINAVGAHCYQHNKYSVGICFGGRGGITPEQKKSGIQLLTLLQNILDIPLKKIYPHNRFNKNKTCPGFDIMILTGGVNMTKEQETKIDWEKFGKAIWHKGFGEGLKVIAEGTENKIDDTVVDVIDKIVDSVLPEEPTQ